VQSQELPQLPLRDLFEKMIPMDIINMKNPNATIVIKYVSTFIINSLSSC
ncbi:uncharacterized protein METZ01_LOCUS503371, partial [marine metagenome]